MAITPMDILATWGEISTRREEALINLVAAAVLHKLGETSIEITVHDLQAMHQDYHIVATVGALGVTVRLQAKSSPDPQLPLERP